MYNVHGTLDLRLQIYGQWSVVDRQIALYAELISAIAAVISVKHAWAGLIRSDHVIVSGSL